MLADAACVAGSRSFPRPVAQLACLSAFASAEWQLHVTEIPHDSSRVESFSDAVFAFSATLLVVALEVPSDSSALIAELHGFWAFGLSFGALVLLWSVHRSFFRRYKIADAWTIFLNSVLLFVILFYVYPLKFITQSLVQVLGLAASNTSRVTLDAPEQLQTVFALYGAGFGAIFGCVAMMYRHAGKKSSALGLSALQTYEAFELARHYGLFVLTAGISVTVALCNLGFLGMAGGTYFLLGPLCFVHGVWSEKRAPKASAT